MNRAITIFAFAMAATSTTLTALAASTPTLITTREGLEAIADNLAGTYTLGADIDLGGLDWTPVGNDSKPFQGRFYGQGHSIRNLVCTNNPSGNSYRGLFGCTRHAIIEWVSVSGTVAGKEYVGGLIGCADGGTSISNCSAAVEVTATGSYAGGFVGACINSGSELAITIIDCRADGFVCGNGYVGGFVSYAYSPSTITNCVARGDV